MILEGNSVIHFQTVAPKQFYRKIEALFKSIESESSSGKFGEAFASGFYKEFAVSLAIDTIILFEELSGRFVRSAFWGGAIEIPAPPEAFLSEEQDSPWIGEILGRRAAALCLGACRRNLIIVVSTREMNAVPGYPVYFSAAFSALQYALIQNRRSFELEDVFEQARAIQMSLLPQNNPELGDFDIAAISLPAKLVGGDVFDFQNLNENSLALMIADAAGHGFAAALQARDIVTGIRMGVAGFMQMTEMVERLNRVIHQSGLTTRFVSLVFGILSTDGRFEYINAGHPRPLLASHNGVFQLQHSGMILGPQPDYRYQSTAIEISHGSSLLLYTDGVEEHQAVDGAEFGVDRLKAWMDDWRGAPAAMALQGLMHRLRDFGNNRPFRDDATLIYISRI